jgi:3-oxoacyl-ACP reductase-like protein
MKKLYTLAITSAVALSMAGCAGGSSSLSPAGAAKIDPNKVCNITEDNPIETVIANAKMYNDAAIKDKVEFRRLNVNNSDLIIGVQEAIKNGSKTTVAKHFKGKKTTKFDTNYAAERACKFGLGALTQKHEAATEWRLAVPGDGFKY